MHGSTDDRIHQKMPSNCTSEVGRLMLQKLFEPKGERLCRIFAPYRESVAQPPCNNPGRLMHVLQLLLGPGAGTAVQMDLNLAATQYRFRWVM